MHPDSDITGSISLNRHTEKQTVSTVMQRRVRARINSAKPCSDTPLPFGMMADMPLRTPVVPKVRASDWRVVA